MMEWLKIAVDFGIIGFLALLSVIAVAVAIDRHLVYGNIKTNDYTDRRGAVNLNSRPVTPEGLKGSIKNLDRSLPILIRADRNISLQVFVDVLDIVKGLEFRKVSLQTEEKR